MKRNRLALLISCLAVAAALPALAGDEASFDFSTAFYFDYFADFSDREDADQTPERGFELRRAYSTLKKSWGDVSIRYTTDIDYKFGTGNLNVYTKYAYLEHKGLVDNAKLLVGQHSPKTHGWVDDVWKYRSMAKSMSDENKWTNGATIGLGLQGKLSEGMFGYYLDLNNGNGYKDPLRKDGMGFAGRLVAKPGDGFVVSGLFTSNTPGTHLDDDDMVVGSDEADTYVEGVAGYATKQFSLYGQYGLFTNAGDDEVKETGLSVFGRALLTDGTYGVARFDMVDPDTDTDDDGYRWILVGLDHELAAGFYLQPSLRITSFQADGADSETAFVLTFFGKI